jgi:hypothetical protein
MRIWIRNTDDNRLNLRQNVIIILWWHYHNYMTTPPVIIRMLSWHYDNIQKIFRCSLIARISVFSFSSVCFETNPLVSVVSKQIRNTKTDRKNIFWFAKQTENQPKQIVFQAVQTAKNCLFRGYPNCNQPNKTPGSNYCVYVNVTFYNKNNVGP